VSIEEIQAAYYMVAATGVLVAAVFYVMNLRETTRNRRATLTNSLIQPFVTREYAKMNLELTKMKWDSFEDFQNKYDSRTNPENYEMRWPIFHLCDFIGYQYKTGLIDVGSVYNVAGLWIADYWLQFGDIIREYRKSDYPSDLFENWEYLAETLIKMRLLKDKDWNNKVKKVMETH
jgi:hypothetical protein